MKLFTIIILGILILGLIVGGYYFDKNYIQKDSEINFGGLQIKSSQLKSVIEPLPEGGFVLCSTKLNRCVAGIKGELD